MKKIAFSGGFLLLCLFSCFGQVSNESITMKKVFGGYMFYQNEKRLNMYKMVKTMQPNEQAYKEIKAAQSTFTLATIIGGAGGFMVGWPLGTALAGGDPEWVMAGIGAGLIVISIPISQKYNKQAKTAVETYNSGLKTSSIFKKTELKFGLKGNGIGLTLRF